MLVITLGKEILALMGNVYDGCSFAVFEIFRCKMEAPVPAAGMGILLGVNSITSRVSSFFIGIKTASDSRSVFPFNCN